MIEEVDYLVLLPTNATQIPIGGLITTLFTGAPVVVYLNRVLLAGQLKPSWL